MSESTDDRQAPLHERVHRAVNYLLCEIPIPPKGFQIRHAVNLNKGLTGFVVAAMMWWTGTTHTAAWLYLGMHGSYGISWLVKDATYPDPSWEREATFGSFLFTFAAMTAYWVPAALLLFWGPAPPSWAMGLAAAMFGLGMQFHHGADAQKYAALEHGADLIDDGFFARTRNPNYLGEVLTYSAFALMATWTPLGWLPWLLHGLVWTLMFIPNWLRKDASLSRHDGWEDYRERTGLFFPSLRPHSKAENDPSGS